MLQVLELRACRTEEFLAEFDVVVHGAAHIQKQQHLHGVVAFGLHANVEQARVACRRRNGAVQVQQVLRTRAREPAQLA